MGHKEQIENLKQVEWHGEPPIILTVAEAYRYAPKGWLYMIEWWEDKPAGFTHFTFDPHEQAKDGHYPIKMLMEPYDPQAALLSANALVLLFSVEDSRP